MILYRKHRNFDILQRKLLYYTAKCENVIYQNNETMKRLYLRSTMENIRVLYQKMILLYRIFWNFELHYYVKNYGTMKKKTELCRNI